MFLLQLFRVILLVIWTLFVSLLAIIVFTISPFNRNLLMPVCRLLGIIGLEILGIKIEVEGLENFSRAHPCIVISNHQTSLDAFVCSYFLPRRTVSLGKKSIKWIPLFGTMYWLTGNILIDRDNKRRAFGSMDKAGRTINDENVSVWIMPEGTRSKGRGILPFKKGAFYTAIGAQRPVLPVFISQYHKNIDLKQWNAGRVLVKIGEPIPTEGMTAPDDVNPLMEKCHQMVVEEVAKLDERNERDKKHEKFQAIN